MAENEEMLNGEATEVESQEEESQTPEKKFSFVKMGIPILLVQILLAYFLANYIIVPKLYGNSSSKSREEGVEEAEAEESDGDEEEGENSDFGKIFTVEDVIVNPAQSKGAQFVLINFGFEVKSDGDVEKMKAREVQIRDILIRIISSKTIDQLDDAQDKEQLRQEIKEAVKPLLPEGHLLNVYFANYIIQ
jgi:flagellar FliL protein